MKRVALAKHLWKCPLAFRHSQPLHSDRFHRPRPLAQKGDLPRIVLRAIRCTQLSGTKTGRSAAETNADLGEIVTLSTTHRFDKTRQVQQQFYVKAVFGE